MVGTCVVQCIEMQVIADKKDVEAFLSRLDLLARHVPHSSPGPQPEESQSGKDLLLKLIAETRHVFTSVVFDNSRSYRERANNLSPFRDLWGTFRDNLLEDNPPEVFSAVEWAVSQVFGYSSLMDGLSLVNEFKTDDHDEDLEERVVPGLQIIAETLEVFPDCFYDGLLEQFLGLCSDIADRNPRDMDKYFNQSDEQRALETKLRAYSSLIVFRSEKILKLRHKIKSKNEEDDTLSCLKSLFKSWEQRFDSEEIYDSAVFVQEKFG